MEKPLAKRKPTQSTNLSAEMNAYVMKGLGPRTLDESAYSGGGGKLSRSEIVTVRLDPKLRYLAELAARKQRRTLSSFIEWAIEQSLAEVKLTETSTIADEAPALWDVDECDRFIKLALHDEGLLNYREQVLWKHLLTQADPGISSRNERKIDWKNLRKIWTQIVGAAETDATGGAPASKHK
jgi:hypothetical protein